MTITTGVRLLRLPEVMRRTGYGKSAIYELESLGKFPRRRKLGGRAVGWRSDEIERWIATRPVAEQQ